MKKIIRKATAVLTLSAIIASFSGCAKNDEPGANDKTENSINS